MSPPPTVSVAMATYNGARFLRAQLESIAAQTRVPDELVVGDDGSTDETAAIVDEFARRGILEVRFTRNAARLGSSQNFAACLARCRGDVVLLSDQDDVWYPSRVQRTLEALDANPGAAFAFSDGDLIDDAGAPLPGRLWEQASFDAAGLRAFREHRGWDVLLRRNVVTGATMGIRRDRIAATLPIGVGWVHDAWLAAVLELRFGAVPIEEPLIRYRLHGAQQVGLPRLTALGSVGLLARRGQAASYRKEAAGCRALADHVARLEHPSASAAAAAVTRKAAWFEARAKFRSSPARLALPLLHAAVSGDYDRFGLGKKQAAFDFLALLVSPFVRD